MPLSHLTTALDRTPQFHSRGRLRRPRIRVVILLVLLGPLYVVRPAGLRGAHALPGPAQAWALETDRQPNTALTYAPPRHLTDLQVAPLWESSGLAASQREVGVFWTHNDSGDKPQLFAFDRDGKHLGTCQLKSASAIDWEDMASFQRNGTAYLLVGDIGNNSSTREAAHLYLIKEPKPDASEAELLWSASFHYDDGPQNGEAVGVDAVSGTILVANKRWTATTHVYALPLPDESPTEPLEAKRIAIVKVPEVTAMDVAPDGLRVVMGTYGNAFEFTRKADEDWATALQRAPHEIEMPPR